MAATVIHARPQGGNAFQIALDRYLQKLKDEERRAFVAAYKDLTADGLVASVKQLDRKHKLGSRFSPAISRTFDVVEGLMRSVSIALQSNPDVSALVVGGARLVLDVALKYVTFFGKLADMVTQLSEYLQVLDTFVQRLQKDAAPSSDKILQCVASVFTDWLDFCREVRKTFEDKKGNLLRSTSIRIFLRVQWDPFESSFGTIKQNFRQNLELLLHSSSAVQYSDIKEILDKVNEASTVQQEIQALTTRRDFMHWISVLDFDDDHERISSRKHPGTADWLIEKQEFQTWVNGTSSQLLWCYGKPGSGKSVLASHCLEHTTWKATRSSNIGIAFCYFNYKQAEHQTPRQILSAFIKQLCWSRPNLPDPIINFYRKHVLDARTPSYNAIEKALSIVADEYEELYLVVDALDECQQDLREQILGSIVDLSQNHDCVKAFITSRPENDIMHFFRRLSTPTVCIKAQNTAADIRKYVNDSVADLTKSEKLKVETIETVQTIIDTLVDNADGMFLWVYLQLQSLCMQRSDRDILDELSNLPSGLYETYYRVLGIIEALPDKLQALAQRCLTLVFFAVRPLKMNELIDMAAVTAGFDDMQRLDMHRYKSEDILEACANLLIEDNGVVRPSHFSVQEYFSSMRSPSDKFAKYFMKPEEGHTQVATACLRYLSFHFLRGGVCGSAYSYNARLWRYPCIRYAVLYFDYHIAQAPLDLRIRLEKCLSQPERSLSAAAQIRRNELNMSRDALHSIQYLRSSNKCWYLKPPPYTLHAACWEGTVNVVAALIEEGHNLVERDSEDRTPLYYAALQGFPDICRLFASQTVYKDSTGIHVALRAAISRRHEGVARVLMSMLSDERSIQLCLSYAAYDGEVRMLGVLLDVLQLEGPLNPALLELSILKSPPSSYWIHGKTWLFC